MEVLLLLLATVVAVLIALAAKRGAERAERERQRRWTPVATRPLAAGSVERRRDGDRAGIAPEGQSQPNGGSTPSAARPAGTASRPSRRPPVAPPPAGAPAASSRPADPAPRRSPGPEAVDINSASVEELKTLPGVGVRAAERIVAHRQRHGGFRSVEALEAVEGFDTHRVSRLAPQATAGGAERSSA